MIQFHELSDCARYYRQPALVSAVGFIPTFLSESDPRPAREQFASNYVDGWQPTSVDFKLRPGPMPKLLDGDNIPKLRYPGDPDLPPLAYALLREEMIVVYPSAWVMVLQADGSHEIVRMD